MEVILNSDIARLVLGYLKDQNLVKAHRKFCQTSKYLKDEYVVLCRGYQPVSVSNLNLIDIIKEYCDIKSKINQFINLFPNEILGSIQSQSNLTKRLEFILSKAKCEILREADATVNDNNTTKRKRSISISSNTSDTECTDNEVSFVKPTPYYKKSKMLKLHSPNVGYTLISSTDMNENITPRNNNKSDTHAISPAADITALKETLLENTEFQNKLADNINKILNSSVTDKKDTKNDDNGNENPDQIQSAINNAIDNIISTIEQDPIFDHIVQDVVNHQSILYDDEIEIMDNNEELENNIVQEGSSRKSISVSLNSTPKKDVDISKTDRDTSKEDSQINNSIIIDKTTDGNNVIDLNQSSLINKDVEIVDRMKNNFAISNESYHAELLPNFQNLASSHLIITPKSMTSQSSQQQNNQSNLIFINEPTFNSAMPLLNLNNTSSNQFPFVFSSTMLNDSNVSLPFVVNSSPCVPISTSQFPVNFITQQQALPPAPVPVRRGRPRKIMAPVHQQTTITNTQSHQLQINKPILNMVKNSAITTRSAVTSNPVTSSQIMMASNIIYSQATSKTESHTINSNSKISAAIQSVAEVNPETIAHSKLEIPNEIPEVMEIRIPNDEIIIDVTNLPVVQNSNNNIGPIESEPSQPEAKLLQPEKVTTQIESIKTAASFEKKHSATPKQNMKPIENLKVKSNSTPRRKSHVRILDFTTPGRSEILPQQVPSTIERSIHLKSTKGTKIGEFNKFEKISKIEKPTDCNPDGIVTTPKVKKSTRKCVRVLSRSASEENYEKENEKNNSKIENKKVESTTPERNTTIGNVKLSVNLSPMDEWKQFRNISQTKDWDSYLRFVTAADNINNAKLKKTEELAKRKLHKMKLMKERKQSKLAAKRLIKPVRKSPRLQKKRKVKVLEKKRKFKQPLINDNKEKDNKEMETDAKQAESKTSPCTEEVEKIPEKCIEDTVPVVKDDLPPIEVQPPPNDETIPVIDHPHSMASLLETPFKTDIQTNPITPRFLHPMAVEDTPITKILKSLNKHLGSDLKNDIFTPSFAITPGCNLTPPKALDIMTPQSGSYSNRPTDYSSGSSYYRPDESDDKIESLASTSRNKSSVHEFEYEVISTKTTQTCNDEKIVVECPGVLEKVKSFSENSNQIPENVVPHYTFNVPDENVENTEIETKDMDTSSSSSCSCTSSSSSSSDSSNTSYHPKTESEPTTSKIIDEKGEIRYPIRTWITPKKIEKVEVSPEKTKPSTSTLQTDRQKVLRELEEKRIRMRDKIKVSETKPQTGNNNFKSKKNIKQRQGISKQSSISTKASTSSDLATEKMKPPRKNPTPKKLIPLKSNKAETVATSSNSAKNEEDINELIAVLSDDRSKTDKNPIKISDKASVKSEDRQLADEFKDAYQNASSETEDDDEEFEIVLQSSVLHFKYDEKISYQMKGTEQVDHKDFLKSSKSVMNVNFDGRKIQIKASDLFNLYEYTPNKLNHNKKPTLSRHKSIEKDQKLESKKSDSKYKPKDKYDSQSTKSSRNDKKHTSRSLHSNTPSEKKIKVEKPSGVIIPESPEPTNTSTNHSTNAKAQFNLKYKKPKSHVLPAKKTILSRPMGSAIPITSSTVQLNNTTTQELNQSFKIPIKVDMKNKLKPSSSDTINAVLAHLHGTE